MTYSQNWLFAIILSSLQTIEYHVLMYEFQDLENNDYQMWEQMNAFFNANPPDMRIQPCISIPSNTDLDDFLTGSIFQNGKSLDFF